MTETAPPSPKAPDPKPVIDVTPVVKPVGIAAPASAKAAKQAQQSSTLAWSCAGLAAVLAATAWLPWFVPQLATRLPATQQLHAAATTPAATIAATAPNADGVMQSADQQISALAAQVTELKTQREQDTAAMSSLKDDSIARATEAATQKATEAATATASQTAEKVAGQTARDTAIKAVAPILALTRIEDRLARGAAYQNELSQLAPQLSDSQRADLTALAAGGPDNAALARQLDDRQRSLLAAYRESMAVGWWDKIRARLSGLVTISGPDSVPDQAAATYARLRAQVAQDDAAGALATLRMLPQPVRDGLAGVEQALTARARASDVLADVMTKLAAGIPAGAGE